MKNNKINIEIVFIGKPQWEAGWPYVGFNNDDLIENITKHLRTTFSEISFHSNGIITNYNSTKWNFINPIDLSIIIKN